jgi:glycosyltransferase involved in cell wall biosynthesis
MEAELAGTPALFTGYLQGDDLAAAYASSDLLAFPSTTDTFGNVVLEAQAAGIPVIVTDQGGPHENVLPGETGLVVPGGSALALADSIAELASDVHRRHVMGSAARHYMETRGFDAAFEKLWAMYTDTHPAKPATDSELNQLLRAAATLSGEALAS